MKEHGGGGVSENATKKKERVGHLAALFPRRLPMEAVITQAVQALRGERGRAHHEIEARLGRMEGGCFVSGVNPEWFDVLLQRLELCGEWSSQQGWQDSEDTTFEARGRQVRQSRVCNTRDCRIEIHSIHKDRKASACLPLEASRGDAGQDPFRLVSTGVDTLRVSYSTETPAAKQSFPELVRPLHVRLKQRRSFVLESHALEGAGWRFDLTRTWAGRSREEAEQRQHDEPPVCEVELEWIPPTKGVDRLPDAMPASLAASIHAKMAALR